jgi:serine/threonine-protein kinase PknK
MTEQNDSARFRLLYDLGCAFATRIELDELLPFIVQKCREALDAEGSSVLLLDRDRNEFYFPYISDANSEVARRLAPLRFRADLGIAGVVLQSRQPLKVDDTQRDPRFYHGADKVTGLTTRNLIAAPLLSRQEPVGVVEVINRRGSSAFSDDDLHFLEALAGSIAIALENARFYARIRESEATLRTQVGVLRRDLARHDRFSEMIGTGATMAEVFRLMETAAASSITVLIEGETGTGKELVARGIHRAGVRADGPFLAINCAALPETLLESELFGHRRGAFTGAIRDSPGLF